MKLNEYQNAALSTDIKDVDPIHKVLGLAEEAGEVAGKFKKRIRGQDISDEAIAKELGDLLWYIASVSAMIGYSLEDVAALNVAKLQDRYARNAIKGEGDDR